MSSGRDACRRASGAKSTVAEAVATAAAVTAAVARIAAGARCEGARTGLRLHGVLGALGVVEDSTLTSSGAAGVWVAPPATLET
ncbi:hypothetical protein PF008_g26637 [Phytophthora fragariae]|uniref:Uncharacterized protein n=1 Tax=Phytophthora fragariae TaxID=53985 RepID=A0A6G0QH38_9STRA|nr:hypothetical protein PF008_g26637 [Phytophthora fragariae]